MVNKIENQTKKRQARTTESIGVKPRKNKGITYITRKIIDNLSDDEYYKEKIFETTRKKVSGIIKNLEIISERSRDELIEDKNLYIIVQVLYDNPQYLKMIKKNNKDNNFTDVNALTLLKPIIRKGKFEKLRLKNCKNRYLKIKKGEKICLKLKEEFDKCLQL